MYEQTKCEGGQCSLQMCGDPLQKWLEMTLACLPPRHYHVESGGASEVSFQLYLTSALVVEGVGPKHSNWSQRHRLRRWPERGGSQDTPYVGALGTNIF